MFLACPLRSSATLFPAGATNPDSLNWFDFSCPPKSRNDAKAGPMAVASFLESIYFRKGSPKKMTEAAVDAYIAAAHQKDVALEESMAIEDFVASDENPPYVTLESYLDALADDHKYISGTLKWTTDVKVLKWMIQRYKCAIVETYLAEAFSTSPSQLDITSYGSSTKALRKDYTKVWAAFGYDSTGLIVMNSLSYKWGKLGFARIAWSLLDGNVVVGEDNIQTKCFIKAAAFQGCFN